MPGGLTLGFAMHLLCFVTMAILSIKIYVLSSIKHCIIKYQVLHIWCVSHEMPWNHRKFPRSDDLGVSDMKGLISWVAQQISTVTRLIHDKHAPDYQKQEREKLYPTKPGSPLWLLDLSDCMNFDRVCKCFVVMSYFLVAADARVFCVTTVNIW